MPLPPTPAIIFFAAEHLYGVKLTSYFLTIPKDEKILENQKVIKTPVVRNGKQATVGYQPETWKKWT